MSEHGIIAAEYAEPEGGQIYADDAPVIVTMSDGSTETRRANDDINGGGMLAFLRDGGVIQPHTEGPEVYAARIDDAKRRVAVYADTLGERITSIKPEIEKLGWDAKQRAAYDYLAAIDAGGTEQQAIDGADRVGRLQIEQEIALTGETWPEISQKIVANAEAYAAANGCIAGISRSTMAAIDALGSEPTQDQIETVLAEQKAIADAQLQALLSQPG